MELLPNSKCLTKIKNHLQLGLIRELIGLLPVGNNGEPWVHKALLPFQFHLFLPFTQQLALNELPQEILALIQVIGGELHCHTVQAIMLL